MTTTLGLFGLPQTDYAERTFMSTLDFALPIAGPRDLSFRPEFPEQECHVADQGVRVLVQVLDDAGEPADIRTGFVSGVLKFLRPDGTSIDIPAAFATNGLDGALAIVSTAIKPPFDQEGVWYVQAKVALSGVGAFSTRWGCFAVLPNISAD